MYEMRVEEVFVDVFLILFYIFEDFTSPKTKEALVSQFEQHFAALNYEAKSNVSFLLLLSFSSNKSLKLEASLGLSLQPQSYRLIHVSHRLIVK